MRQPRVGRNTCASEIHSSRCAGQAALSVLVLVCLLPDWDMAVKAGGLLAMLKLTSSSYLVEDTQLAAPL